MNTRDYYYNLNEKLEIKYPPQRIVSLVPSKTETLFSLGLGDKVVGRTKYCVHPEGKVNSIPAVGGPKNVDYAAIDSLNPDLIIADKEENTKEIVEKLSLKYPVYMAQLENFDDALKMIKDIGVITGTGDKAARIVNEIADKFEGLNVFEGLKAAYVIWKNPYMVAGGKTFINSILEKLGFSNPFTGFEGRYPRIQVEDFIRTETDVILLASEPFVFSEVHKKELEELQAAKRIILVDGEMFCWAGSHMLEAAEYFKGLEKELKK